MAAASARIRRNAGQSNGPGNIEPPSQPKQRKGSVPYEYAALPTPTSIRLVKLSGRSPGNVPIGQIVTFELNQSPPFFALSYTWGTKRRNRKFSCDGRELKVSPNLKRALRRLVNLKGCEVSWSLSSDPTGEVDVEDDWFLRSDWFWIDQVSTTSGFRVCTALPH
jgi:hypothetical protein